MKGTNDIKVHPLTAVLDCVVSICIQICNFIHYIVIGAYERHK